MTKHVERSCQMEQEMVSVWTLVAEEDKRVWDVFAAYRGVSLSKFVSMAVAYYIKSGAASGCGDE